jgi:hypothetical protein
MFDAYLRDDFYSNSLQEQKMMQCDKCNGAMARVAVWFGIEIFQCDFCGYETTLPCVNWADDCDDYSDYDPNHIINNYDPAADDQPF